MVWEGRGGDRKISMLGRLLGVAWDAIANRLGNHWALARNRLGFNWR